MNYFTLIVVLVGVCSTISSQEITGPELLDKSIAYHDPKGHWSTFNNRFKVVMESPENPKRISRIHINLPESYFRVEATRDTITTTYIIDKTECRMALNGNSDLSKAELLVNNLSCESAHLYKNYYTYLYGLPMKLKDEGTVVDDTILRKFFKGKEYLVLKVTYDEVVGNDIWYFYFNRETYAMATYQFFKTDDNGKAKLDSGEYILLSETETINHIKMPKIRAWYYNKDDGYLGTDTLEK